MGQDRIPPNLHNLPPELLDSIIFFLPLKSILHLMVNRTLRSACEPDLYRNIWIINQPNRSLRLLNTLSLRPDLALTIRELKINLGWFDPKVVAGYKLPDVLQPDGLAPLSLVRNIRSLDIGGLKWLSSPSLANIRRIVSQMELTSLVISGPYYTLQNSDQEANQIVISNLRAILQSQPQLEFLSLTPYAVQPALLNAIEDADVSNLRKFQGTTSCAEVFLDVAPKISKLDLQFEREGLAYSPSGEGWNGHKIRALVISLDLNKISNWDDFGSFLARFPNTESLSLTPKALTNQQPLSFYIENIAPRLRVLPLLRKLEIRGLYITTTKDLDRRAEVLLKFKKHCPVLERFIDTYDRQWVYIPSFNEVNSWNAKLDCQLECKRFSHMSDLPRPKWDM